jgi:hypothetical protein
VDVFIPRDRRWGAARPWAICAVISSSMFGGFVLKICGSSQGLGTLGVSPSCGTSTLMRLRRL